MIILASNSPRRKQLLAFGGWSFQVLPVDIDEGVMAAELPDAYVLRLSHGKACAARELLLTNMAHAGDLIVSADTTVVLPLGDDDREAARLLPEFQSIGELGASQYIILGKPMSAEHAGRILAILRNRVHQVYTGVTIMRISDDVCYSTVCITDVPMRDYTDDEIRNYIASGDPFDKAGAYAIQNKDFHPAQNLHGCYANVMGLPVCHLAKLLEKMGVQVDADITSRCLHEFDYACPISKQILQQ
jgi:septum formation protein